jgi:hypothetical protein
MSGGTGKRPGRYDNEVPASHTAWSCPTPGCDFAVGGGPLEVLSEIEEHERYHAERFTTPAVVQLDHDDATERLTAALTGWDAAYDAHTSGQQADVADVIDTFDAYQVAVRELHAAYTDWSTTTGADS